MKRLKQWWLKWAAPQATPAPAATVKVAPVRAITARELEERFAAAPGNPLFEAVLLVVEEHILDQMGAAMGQDIPDRDHRWHLGGAAALEKLRDDLKARAEAARVEKEQDRQAAVGE